MGQRKLVLFGASGASVKVADMLDSIDATYDFFVDNNSEKWGTTFKGKKVLSPNELLIGDYNIIVASTYQAEIEEQLKTMGLYENVIWKEQLMLDYIKAHMWEFESYKTVLTERANGNSRQCSVIMDLEYGLGLGGTESWVFDVSKELLQRGHTLQIFTKKTKYLPPKSLENHVTEFPETYEAYWTVVKEMTAAISEQLPCSIVINAYNQIMFAAVIAKQLFGEKVKLVLMAHNDNLYVYRRIQLLLPYFDVVSGVSKKIVSCLEHEFSVEQNKLYYKESAVDFESDLEKTYTINQENPIIIGFAGRIQKEQKRCDYIAPLVDYLEDTSCHFQLHIAGKGSFYDQLKAYAEKSEKIKLFGHVSREQMPDFWKKCDIYLSLSDYEGASLSMLEAMSYGVVPVVTEVSGVKEFVKNNENGFFCPKGKIEEIGDKIKYLDTNRNCLQLYGEKARAVIQQKCNKEDYVTYIETLLA